MSDVISSPPIYHTPNNAPTEYICRRLFIPNDLDWLKLVNGALGTLGVTDFFTETDGGVSIDDTVAEFLEMIVNSHDGCPSEGEALQVAYFYYQEDDGNAGIDLTQYADTIVPLNVANDPENLAVLNTYSITPIAGRYEIDALVANRGAGRPRAVWKIGGTRLLLGHNSDNEDNHCHLSGLFTADGTTAYYLALYTNASGAKMGRAVDTTGVETYAALALRRLGD